MDVSLSIIIVNWNTRALVIDCLESIRQHPPSSAYEIWVVDNASSDDSVAAVKAAFPDVRLIENERNSGFAAANNQAIQVSSGEAVMLLNSDTLVREHAFDRLLAALEAYPQIGIVGARLLNQDGSLQPSWAAFPTIWSELRGVNVRKVMPFRDASNLQSVDWVGGAALLIRRRATKQVGLMDERFFMYSEETDWCYRVKQAGWEICYCTDAEITHLGGQSTKRVSVQMKTELFRSKLRFFRTHYGTMQAGILRTLVQSGLFFKAAIGGIVRHTGGQRARAGAQMQQEALAIMRGIDR